MAHIVDSTVPTPAWQATANLVAAVFVVAMLCIGGVIAALTVDSFAGATLAAIAGIAVIAISALTAPRVLVEAR